MVVQTIRDVAEYIKEHIIGNIITEELELTNTERGGDYHEVITNTYEDLDLNIEQIENIGDDERLFKLTLAVYAWNKVIEESLIDGDIKEQGFVLERKHIYDRAKERYAHYTKRLEMHYKRLGIEMHTPKLTRFISVRPVF